MVATRFAVALHILLLLSETEGGEATSARLARRIGTNPVVVRRIAGLLARAGLVVVHRGPGGAALARPAEGISLSDVWRAVHPVTQALLRVHRGPAEPAERPVPALLRGHFDRAEAALLAHLAETNLAVLAQGMRHGDAAHR